MAKRGGWKRWLLIALGVVVVLAPPAGLFVWYSFFRELPQPEWITSDDDRNFLYGSIGSENEGGMPYWIVITLPRIFPEYLPGPGGYASLGLPWEEGVELPAGFSVKTIGFKRVGFNCALCHAARYRTTEEETPTVVAAGGSHTADIQGLLEFFSRSAADPRFNSETILNKIDQAYPLSARERLIYKLLLVPLTRKILIEQGREFEWTRLRPRWGPGRDAPMNLTKYPFLGMEPDDLSVDNTDFPSIWNMRVREGRPDQKLNLDGATPVLRSVIIDSALGLQATNTPFFHRRVAQIEEWLKEVPPPAYPLPYDRQLAAAGKPIFERLCAGCHASDPPGARMGTVIPIDEIGTDRERMDTWTQEAADRANEAVAALGIQRDGMEKHEGYVAIPLDGLWLKAPYLHNGAVPTVRDLLNPVAERPAAFYRGYDVIDPVSLGFISTRCPPPGSDEPPPRGPGSFGEPGPKLLCMPPHRGWRHDVSERGNGNWGHEGPAYGTELSGEEKEALIEYLKSI